MTKAIREIEVYTCDALDCQAVIRMAKGDDPGPTFKTWTIGWSVPEGLEDYCPKHRPNSHPTPWQVNEDTSGYVRVLDATGKYVASIAGIGIHKYEIAQRIVDAVNLVGIVTSR